MKLRNIFDETQPFFPIIPQNTSCDMKDKEQYTTTDHNIGLKLFLASILIIFFSMFFFGVLGKTFHIVPL